MTDPCVRQRQQSLPSSPLPTLPSSPQEKCEIRQSIRGRTRRATLQLSRRRRLRATGEEAEAEAALPPRLHASVCPAAVGDSLSSFGTSASSKATRSCAARVAVTGRGRDGAKVAWSTDAVASRRFGAKVAWLLMRWREADLARMLHAVLLARERLVLALRVRRLLPSRAFAEARFSVRDPIETTLVLRHGYALL